MHTLTHIPTAMDVIHDETQRLKEIKVENRRTWTRFIMGLIGATTLLFAIGLWVMTQTGNLNLEEFMK